MRVVRVFVSSPGDCSTEREIVDEVVRRINLSDRQRADLILQTFAWENDVVPRIGRHHRKWWWQRIAERCRERTPT